MRLINNFPIALSIFGPACISLFILYCNRDLTFMGLDGKYMLINVRNAYDWTTPALGFFANPSQGLSDIWFGLNAWLQPGFLIPYLLLGMPENFGYGYRIAVYATHVLIFSTAILFALRSCRIPLSTIVLAPWVFIGFALPLAGQSIFYPIYCLQPAGLMSTSLFLFLLGGFSRCGQKNQNLVHNFSLLCFCILLQHWAIFIGPSNVILAIPFAIIALASLISSYSRSEKLWKASIIILMAAIPFLTGTFSFVLGFLTYTVPSYFPNELMQAQRGLYFVSILFHKATYGLVPPLFLIVSLAGAFLASFDHKSRVSWLARMTLLTWISIFSAGIWSVYDGNWQGPALLYFEICLWPILTCFFIYGLVRAGLFLAQWIFRSTRMPIAFSEKSLIVYSQITMGMVLSLTALLHYNFGKDPTVYFSFPQAETSAVSYLQKEIGLQLNEPVTGRVATMWMREDSRSISWLDLHNNDAQRSLASGNEMDTIGLWDFNLATVQEYSPALSPALFKATKTLMANERDLSHRNILTLRREADPKLLAMMGVSHILTDSPLDKPYILKMTEILGEKHTIYLYEVPDRYFGTSITSKLVLGNSFDEALGLISNPTFDTSSKAVILDPVNPEILNRTFFPVDHFQLIMVKNGYEVNAKSEGESLLMLPILYSHCLSFDTATKSDVELLQLNGFLTGIKFAGELKGHLKYFNGPFKNSSCRINDANQFSKLLTDN